MKKIKFIVAAMTRGTLLIIPGISFAIWQWGEVPALVNILAAVGLESIFLFVFAFIKVIFDVARKRASQNEQNTGSVDSDTTE